MTKARLEYLAAGADDIATLADPKVAELVARYAAGLRDERLGDAHLTVATQGRVVLMIGENKNRGSSFPYDYLAYLSASWARANL